MFDQPNKNARDDLAFELDDIARSVRRLSPNWRNPEPFKMLAAR
jgi:hypothetical protein